MERINDDETERALVKNTSKKRAWLEITGFVSGGMFIDGYILGGLGPVIAAVTAELSLSVFWQGLVASAALMGIFFGGPVGGWLSDKVGRRPMFAINIVTFLLCSILLVFVDAVWSLFLLRLVMGMAIGSDYSIGQPLLAEFAPARMRGGLLAFSQACWYLGFMIAFTVGFGLSGAVDVDWRFVLATTAVPSAMLLIARIRMPESPRWLKSKGRIKEARDIAERYLEDPEDVFIETEENSAPSSFRVLFTQDYIRTTAFTSIFYFCAVTPYFAIATFAADVLAVYGLDDGLTGGLSVNGLALVGVLVAVVLVERIGRRKLIIPPQVLCAVTLAAIGLWTGAPAGIVLGCFLVFAFANAMCSALAGFISGEVFPTHVRGIGCGFATAVSRIGAGVGTFLLPLSMANLGAATTMLIASGLCLTGAAVSQVLAPETKGRSLSEISARSVR